VHCVNIVNCLLGLNKAEILQNCKMKLGCVLFCNPITAACLGIPVLVGVALFIQLFIHQQSCMGEYTRQWTPDSDKHDDKDRHIH